MQKLKQDKMDMLNGSIWDKLLMFALPLALTGMLQQLFNAADVAVVGRYVGKNAMAAVGSNSPIIGLLVNGFVGIALGANVVMSMFSGQKNKSAVSKCVHTSILLAITGGIAVTVIGEIIAPGVLRLMSVPDEIFPMALAYLRIYFLGMPVIFLYNFEAAVFRSQGDTKTPLFCLVVSGVINVITQPVFCACCGHECRRRGNRYGAVKPYKLGAAFYSTLQAKGHDKGLCALYKDTFRYAQKDSEHRFACGTAKHGVFAFKYVCSVGGKQPGLGCYGGVLGSL